MIWLLRHGAAEDGSPDEARRLTAKGRDQAANAGRALASLGVDIEACLSSPKARAMETAELACKPLDVEVETTDALAGGDFDPAELGGGRGEVLLVGHEPDFSRAVGLITGGRVDLKKGGIAAIADGELRLLLRPAELKQIAG